MLAGLVTTAPAHADHSSLHLTATGDVATTDNVFSSPSDREGDMFFQVRPGVLWALDGPRMIHELDAEVELLEYVLHSDSPSVTFHGGWKGVFLPGPRSELTVVANGSTGKVNAITARTAADQTVVTVTPTGTEDIDQADASESLSWQSTKASRVSEQGFGRWGATDDNMGTTTSTAEVGVMLGLEAALDHNSLGIEVGGSFLRLERIAPATAAVGMGSTRTDQVEPRGTLIWRHDLTKQWSFNLDGGGIYVEPVGTDPYNPTVPRIASFFPTFGGLVAYSEVWGRAALNINRSVSQNLFLASNTVDDSAVLQLALPLPWLGSTRLAQPKLVALGTLGAERSQLIDASTGGLQGEFKVARLDAEVGYTPRPGVTYGVRYEFIYQTGNSTATMLIPTYFRNTLFFTFSFRYPDRLAAEVPVNTQSVRADRSDLSPVGAEPVVTDEPVEQSEGGE